VHQVPEQYGHSSFGRSGAGHGSADHDADAVSSGVVAALTPDHGHEQGHGEELPSYVYPEDDAKYADLQRDAKPRPDSEWVLALS
jgi:hypothetical protein